jgi:threonine synthase
MGLLLHLAVDAVAGDTRLAISSCGNAALGAATVARAAGRPIDVFIPTWADRVVVDSLQQLEATIHVCERRDGELGDPCMARFQEAVADGALPFGVQATENRWTLDGGRTIGWELAAALAGLDGGPVDHVLVQVGGGALLTSCAIGLLEAADAGVLERAPGCGRCKPSTALPSTVPGVARWGSIPGRPPRLRHPLGITMLERPMRSWPRLLPGPAN